ncbi:fumarylacetoacetate hydrolase [Sphingobium sp. AP50]|uniref:fumarylacetoacetase n=1 Tax=Sphingobium sp. AP50 TaxID=1884369 RepID=UPI0008CD0122|nr:fumarylacetoacetase [Sphingobium sp. AP50]SEJ73773.1 fumarylacetoacetate hydrolase [Sphingobium sp. AP50]
MTQWWNVDETHAADRISWVDSAVGHADFPVQNLPYGLFAPHEQEPRIGVAIGDLILDLWAVAQIDLLDEGFRQVAASSSVNALLSLPVEQRRALRRRISELLTDEAYRSHVEPYLFDAAECTLFVPAQIGDYTDFYVGIHHATNIGRQFRPDAPLLPNYKYVPIGYHGRASSIRPSGVAVRRPSGQRKPPEADVPVFGPCTRLDYELEIGVWIAQGNTLGSPISIQDAADHIGGFCLLNDWSARDFQAWEYQPLGPFLSKSFHSTISPWVVTTDAMAPFRVAQPPRPEGDPQPLPYLSDELDQQHGALKITLEVFLLTASMREQGLPPFRVSQGPATNMYWTVNQIVTHHASNGCNLNPGDLLGTGTISAPERSGFGSLLELSTGGQEPIHLPNGESRGFLEDGDEIILRGTASAPGFVSIGLGECRAKIQPA